VPPDTAWLARLPDVVRVVTLAPEAPSALDAVAMLAARGVLVSLGHSTADLEQATAAVDAGARLVTHVFNAMPALDHRRPGLVGAALSDDRLVVSLIADFAHVHPAVVRVAFRAKGAARVALVTDAVAWRSGRVAGRQIALRDGAPRLPDGTLAGSALTMDGAVRNCVSVGIDLADAVAAASAVPARLLDLSDRGRIEAGAAADLVELGPELHVRATWVAGRQAHG
jgi:N-acetylglucosamine-6-phosphate deacetylase